MPRKQDVKTVHLEGLIAHLSTVMMMEGRDASDPADIAAHLLDRPTWHAEAACRGDGPSLWFSKDADDIERARAVCARCPVAGECYDAAIARGLPQDDGVAGGATRGEREQAIRAARGLARPPARRRPLERRASPAVPAIPDSVRASAAAKFAEIRESARARGAA